MKIKIHVIVDENGDWTAYGGNDLSERQCIEECLGNVCPDVISCHVIIEADIPLPKSSTVEGKVIHVGKS